MPRLDIVRKVEIERTPRVVQLESMFDIPVESRSEERWFVDFELDRPWNVGMIVGPSGCGKTSVLREVFGDHLTDSFEWDERAVVDNFPESMSIKDVVRILSSVGFSSPPSWLRPYHVLSNGEKFRVHMARVLCEAREMCAIDEFTSVVDRTVAKVGSDCVQKTVRKLGKKLVVASCHYDIEDWLQPDWVYKPRENEFRWRLLRRRPGVELKIFKVHTSAWAVFKKHHYLTSEISKSAQCFVAEHEKSPVAFMSFVHNMHKSLKNSKRGHRVVVLPDYQGIGIGNWLIEYIAGGLKAAGFDFIGPTSNPGMIAYWSKSPKWTCIRKPKITINSCAKGLCVKHLFRQMATFRYIGPGVQDAKPLVLGWQ